MIEAHFHGGPKDGTVMPLANSHYVYQFYIGSLAYWREAGDEDRLPYTAEYRVASPVGGDGVQHYSFIGEFTR